MKFDLTRKQHLILTKEIIHNHMNYKNNEDFINILMKENNCSSIDKLYDEIDAEIKAIK